MVIIIVQNIRCQYIKIIQNGRKQGSEVLENACFFDNS